jgi:hypothetical protein
LSDAIQADPDGRMGHRTGLPVDRKVFAVAAALAVGFVL